VIGVFGNLKTPVVWLPLLKLVLGVIAILSLGSVKTK